MTKELKETINHWTEINAVRRYNGRLIPKNCANERQPYLTPGSLIDVN